MSIDLNAVRSVIKSHLPRRVRWMLDRTPLAFDFSEDRFNLRRVYDSDVIGGPVPSEWSEFRLFGSYEYAGGACPYIAIRDNDGFVCGLDIERDGEWTFVFNSSLDRFISTFALIDLHLRVLDELPPDLTNQAEALDPQVFAVSEWQGLIELITTT